jgi:hypothetical protein
MVTRPSCAQLEAIVCKKNFTMPGKWRAFHDSDGASGFHGGRALVFA